jgi:hypothetical protein
MKQKKGNFDHELFTYTEYKEKLFPSLKRDENIEEYLSQDSFLDFLKKVTHPVGSRHRRRDNKDK